MERDMFMLLEEAKKFVIMDIVTEQRNISLLTNVVRNASTNKKNKELKN
jgi:hypothetical protein